MKCSATKGAEMNLCFETFASYCGFHNYYSASHTCTAALQNLKNTCYVHQTLFQ